MSKTSQAFQFGSSDSFLFCVLNLLNKSRKLHLLRVNIVVLGINNSLKEFEDFFGDVNGS